jgi:predicted phage terminase large subunit-like protein
MSAHLAAQAVLDRAMREHFSLFLMRVYAELHPGSSPLELGWYLQAISHALGEAARTEGTRLVINVPPRHLKSVAVAVAYPAWLLGLDPKTKIMVATYNEDLGRLHARNTRQVMESDWYKALFATSRLEIKGSRLMELRTTEGGSRKAVTVGGTVTGHGADVIIMDDILKADEARSEARREEAKAWFDGSLATRINNMGGGTIIAISQRLHEDDPPAHLLAKGYDHLCLPAIAEKDEHIAVGRGVFHHRKVGDLLGRAGITADKLEAERRKMGAYHFSSQHQQNPVAPGGNIVRLEWFPSYDEEFEREDFQCVVQSWDTASSDLDGADYSVCLTFGWREKRWHLVDVLRQRLDFPELKRAVNWQHHRWTPDVVLIEDANSGKSLWQEFRATRAWRPVMWKPDRSKEERLIGVTGQLEAGMLALPVDAPWLDDFRRELRAFPYGRNDDQVDALSQFFEYYLLRASSLLAARDPNTGRRLYIDRGNRIVRPVRQRLI